MTAQNPVRRSVTAASCAKIISNILPTAYGTDIVTPDETHKHATDAPIVQRSVPARRSKRRKSDSDVVFDRSAVAGVVFGVVVSVLTVVAAAGDVFDVDLGRSQRNDVCVVRFCNQLEGVCGDTAA